MVAAASITGYLLIPRKPQIISPNQEALAEMVRKRQLRLDVDHKTEKPGMLKPLLTMAVTWIAKAGMGYMGERMRTVAAQKAQERSSAAYPTSSIH
jgi:hypothetical protein